MRLNNAVPSGGVPAFSFSSPEKCFLFVSVARCCCVEPCLATPVLFIFFYPCFVCSFGMLMTGYFLPSFSSILCVFSRRVEAKVKRKYFAFLLPSCVFFFFFSFPAFFSKPREGRKSSSCL